MGIILKFTLAKSLLYKRKEEEGKKRRRGIIN